MRWPRFKENKAHKLFLIKPKFALEIYSNQITSDSTQIKQ